MAGPSVTYSFSNSTTADATQCNQNFTDLINGATDGTKDYSINALTCAGAATLNGNVTLGNSSSDDVTVTGSLASSIPIKTTFSYDIGAATLGLKSIYLGSNDSAARSVRVIAGAVSASYSLTLPTAVPTAAKSVMTFDTSATATFEPRGTLSVVSKTTTYTATAADDLILCSGSAFTVTLPAASDGKKVFKIKKTDSTLANIITIARAGSDTIEDNAAALTSTTLNTIGETITLVADGTATWHVIDRHIPSQWADLGTPTFSNVTLGSGVYHGYVWRRVGDSVEIRGQTTLGTGGSLSGNLAINPFGGSTNLSGLTMDTAKAAGDSSTAYKKVGTGSFYDATADVTRIGTALSSNTSTNTFLLTSTGITGNVDATAPMTWADSDQFHIHFIIPISGWKG